MPVPSQFIEQNYWWRDKEALRKDKHLLALQNSKVTWNPRIKFYFTWDQDAVYTLRGPRQIGKTTMLKVFINELMTKGLDPRTIFYHSCDLIDSPKALTEMVSLYVDSVRQDSRDRLYIFLDEISSVRDWQKGIKHLVDIGKFENCTVLLTGSHSIDVKTASENLAGRRGKIKDAPDKVLLPMKFAEYAETLNPEIRKALTKTGILLRNTREKCIDELTEGHLPTEVNDISLYSKELKILFDQYLMTGGIPRVIDEFLKDTHIQEEVYRTYVDTVVGDLTRWGKKENYLRQVISRVSETTGTPISWNALRNNTDIVSHATFADYVDLLCSAFALIGIYHVNLMKGRPIFDKDKKIYFHDPFIYHAMRSWANSRSPFENTLEFLRDSQKTGSIVEGIVADHLIRCAFGLSSQKQLFEYTNEVFYWRSDKQREVDFLLRLRNGKYMPIEVKYQPETNKDDKQSIFDFQKTGYSTSGLILSNGELKEGKTVNVIPVWLFLMLI